MKHFSSFWKQYTWVSRLLILCGVILAYGWALQGLKVDFELLKNSWPYVTDFISRL